MPVLRQMLVAVDFSVCSRHAAQHAFDVARSIGGTVTLLHVLEDHGSEPEDLEAAQTLLRQLGLLARRPPNCLIAPARSDINRRSGAAGLGDDVGHEDGVALAILAVVDHLVMELIVMGLHGRGNSCAGTLGRVARRVLLDANIPVQVVPCSFNKPTTGRWSAALLEDHKHIQA